MTRQQEFDSLLDLLIDGEFSPIEDWIQDQEDPRKWIQMIQDDLGKLRREWLYYMNEYDKYEWV